MAYEGKTHLTFIFRASPADVAEGDRLFASHNAWMAKTHHREGPKALLTYPTASNRHYTRIEFIAPPAHMA